VRLTWVTNTSPAFNSIVDHLLPCYLPIAHRLIKPFNSIVDHQNNKRLMSKYMREAFNSIVDHPLEWFLDMLREYILLSIL
jgi:hypothetical protein